MTSHLDRPLATTVTSTVMCAVQGAGGGIAESELGGRRRCGAAVADHNLDPSASGELPPTKDIEYITPASAVEC